jgi:hypothetical protein
MWNDMGEVVAESTTRGKKGHDHCGGYLADCQPGELDESML